jgi:hypothetical protein
MFYPVNRLEPVPRGNSPLKGGTNQESPPSGSESRPLGGFTILASEVNAGLFFSSSIRLRVVNKRRKSAVTTNQALAAASAVFAWAMRRDLLAVNPCAKVDRNPTKSRDRVLLRVRVPMRKSVGLSSPEMIGA